MIFILAILSLSVASIATGLFLWNLLVYRRLPAEGVRLPAPAGPVSVLIPARNEESNIGKAVRSVLASRGVQFEVVVMDDASSDRTREIVQDLARCDARVRLLDAPPLPVGWCGKANVCHALSQVAQYPNLLFMDADVELEPDGLARLSHALASGRAAFISGVPRQLTGSFGEKLLIPLIHFVLLGYLPMFFARRNRRPAFAAGCGQLVLVRAAEYGQSGGHMSVKDSMHDGLKLARAFRRAGFFTEIFDATDIARCRLYHSGREVWNGLSKNAVEALAAPGTIGPMTFLLFSGQVLPWMVLLAAAFVQPSALPWATLAVLLSLLPRLISVPLFKQPALSALLHPLGILTLLAIQWQALHRYVTGRKPSWKGREYGTHVREPQKIKLAQSRQVASFVLACSLGFNLAIAADQPVRLSTIEMSDQFGRTQSCDFEKNGLTLLLVADKKGQDEVYPWVQTVRKKFGGRVAIQGIAQVAGVPGPFKPMVRKQLKDAQHSILMDWEGEVTSRLAIRKNIPNVFLIGSQGQVLFESHGPAGDEALNQLIGKLRHHLPQASRAGELP